MDDVTLPFGGNPSVRTNRVPAVALVPGAMRPCYTPEERADLVRDIEAVLNKHSVDALLDMHDYVLAEYVVGVLANLHTSHLTEAQARG